MQASSGENVCSCEKGRRGASEADILEQVLPVLGRHPEDNECLSGR
ncbi:MAG: hypothetical protein OXL36_05790 [Bryobacterales bacterium]|nr:hypothetical protein [Bryobacterales bacterium]